jgi:hypothetical protein
MPNSNSASAEAISALGPVLFNKVFMGSNPCIGINLRNNANLIAFNTLVGGSIGINKNSLGAAINCMFNTIVNPSGDGIDFPSASTARVTLIGNHITGCGGYGIDLNTSTIDKIIYGNRFRNNTSGNLNATDDWTSVTNIFELTTTGTDSTDFVDSGANNFALLDTAPAFQKALFAHYLNIGANGSPFSGGGGGGGEHSYVTIG